MIMEKMKYSGGLSFKILEGLQEKLKSSSGRHEQEQDRK